jgi:hypothetical protein
MWNDFETATFTIPCERMKCKKLEKANGVPHVVPLAPQPEQATFSLINRPSTVGANSLECVDNQHLMGGKSGIGCRYGYVPPQFDVQFHTSDLVNASHPLYDLVRYEGCVHAE